MAQITTVDIPGPPRMDVTVNPVLESVRPFFQGLPTNPSSSPAAAAATPVPPPQHGFPPTSSPSYWPARTKTPPHSAKSPALASPLHHIYNGTKIGETVQPAAQHNLPPIAALGYPHSRHRALPAATQITHSAAKTTSSSVSPRTTHAQFRAPEYPHHSLYSPNSSNQSHRSNSSSPYQSSVMNKYPPLGSPAVSSPSPHAYSYSPRTSLPLSAATTASSTVYPQTTSSSSVYVSSTHKQPTPQPQQNRPPSNHQSHYPMSPVIQQPNQELQHMKLLQQASHGLQQSSQQPQISASHQASQDQLPAPSPIQQHQKQFSSQTHVQHQQQHQPQQQQQQQQQQHSSHLPQGHDQILNQQPMSHLQQPLHYLGSHQSLNRTEHSNEQSHQNSQQLPSHHQSSSSAGIHQYPTHLQHLSSVVQQANQQSNHPSSASHGPPAPQHSSSQQQSNTQHISSKQSGHPQHSNSHHAQHSSYSSNHSQRLSSQHSSIQTSQPQLLTQLPSSQQSTHHHSTHQSNQSSYPHHSSSQQPSHHQQLLLQQSQNQYSNQQTSQQSIYPHLTSQQPSHLHQSVSQPLHHPSYQQSAQPQHPGSHQSAGQQVHSPRSSQQPSPSQQTSRHQALQTQHQRHPSLSDLKQAPSGYHKHLLQQHQHQQNQHQQQQQQQSYYSQQSDVATAAKLVEMQNELRIKQRQLAAVQAQQQAYYAAAATSSSTRQPAQTITTIEASSQQGTSTTQALSLAGGVKRESPLDLSVKTVRQSADSTAKDDSESLYLSNFQNQDAFHRSKSHIKTASPHSPAILPPLQQPSAVAYPQFENDPSNKSAASGMPKVDFLPNFTHHTSSGSFLNHLDPNKGERKNSSSQLASSSMYPSHMSTLPHMGSFKKSSMPSSVAYSDPNKPSQYYQSSGPTPQRSAPLTNHSSNMASAPISSAQYSYDTAKRANPGRYDYLDKRTSASPMQSTSSKESNYSLSKRHSTSDFRYHLPPKIPRGVDTWRQTIDQQIEQRLNSYASSRGHQMNGTKDSASNKELTRHTQAVSPYSSTNSPTIQTSHAGTTLPSSNSMIPTSSLYSSQRSNSTSKLVPSQYYPPGQPQYPSHPVPPRSSQDAYAYPKLPDVPASGNAAADKERVLSILRKRLDTREATNQLIQQQLAHQHSQLTQHQDRSKMYVQSHSTHHYPQQPGIPSPVIPSQAKPIPQTPVGRHNLPPFNALSLERNPPMAYATQKLHLPKAMDSVAFDHPSSAHHIRGDVPASTLPSRTEAAGKPATGENGTDFDGLAAFLAARIRTKAELKQVGPSVDLQRSSNSASGSNSSVHSPRTTPGIFSPPPQGIHSQTAVPPDFGKGMVTPSLESDRASSSGFSSSSPMKGSRDRYGINSPRRRLFCRPDEEGGGENVIQAREGGLRSSSETSVFDFRDSDSDGEAGPRLEDLRKDRQNNRRLQEKSQPLPSQPLPSQPLPTSSLESLDNPVGDVEPIDDSFWSGMCDQFVTQLQKGGNKVRKKARQRKWCTYTRVEEPILMMEQYEEMKYEPTSTSEVPTVTDEFPDLNHSIKIERVGSELVTCGPVLEVKKEVKSDEAIASEETTTKDVAIKEENPEVEETVRKVEAKLLPELKIVLRPEDHIKKEVESSDEDAPLAKRQSKLKLLSAKFKRKSSIEKVFEKKSEIEKLILSSDSIKKEDIKKEVKKVMKKEYSDSEAESSAEESFDSVRKPKRRGRKPKEDLSENRRKTRSSEKENSSTPRKVGRKKKGVKVKPMYGDGSEFKPGWEAEVYRYKRSLRMPARLINIAGPQSWPRQSASLPDLDPDSPMTLDSELSLQTKQFESDEESTPTKKHTDSPKSKATRKLKDKVEEDSFLNKLVQRYGGKGKKSLRKCLEKDSSKDRKAPKIIPQTNELKLLPTPSLDCIVKTPVKKDQQKQKLKGKKLKDLSKPIDFESGEAVYLGYFRKKTVADFRDAFAKHNGGFATEHELPPIILKSRTRTQTRILTQRATIREVFGDDRPASAPPLGCRNREGDLGETSVVDGNRKTNKGLKNKMLLKKRKKSVLSSGNRPGLRSAAVLRSNKAVLKSKQQLLHGVARRRRSKDLIRAYTSGNKYKKEPKTKPSKEVDLLVKTEELEDNSIVKGDEVPIIVSGKRLNKYKGVRRKLKSSGFDYIRKKKKQQQKKEVDVEVVKEKKKIVPTKPILESEEDIQNEIKGWVINKGHGETVLHRAARLGYTDVAAYCLEKMDHNPSPRDNAGYTPLHEACARGRLDIARLLLMYGADASDSARGGIRPLHEAAESGCLEVIRLLLSYGADPLLASYSGLTPLSLMHSNPDAGALLLNHLADVQGNPAPPWQVHLTDPTLSGYDPLAGAPSPDPSDAEMEVESAELSLPHLYQLRGEPPTDRYVLFQELGPLLRVKTREALIKQLGPSHRNDFRDLKMTEFYDMARCCSILGAGDFVLNPKAHKVTLVRYSERVGVLLNSEKVSVSAR